MSLYMPRTHAVDGSVHFRDVYKDLTRMSQVLQLPRLSDVSRFSHQERLRFDAMRLDYVSRGIVVDTPTVTKLREQAGLRAVQNHAKSTGGAGVYLSSASNNGKTTAIRCLLRDTLAAYRAHGFDVDKQLSKKKGKHRKLPVGLFTMPEVGNMRDFCNRGLAFFGIPTTSRTPEDSLISTLASVINKADMQFLALDEVHRIAASNDQEKAADAIRGLADSVRATVILSGINLEKHAVLNGNLDGNAAEQIGTRFFSSHVYNYANAKEVDRNLNWRRLVNGMLRATPLYRLDRAMLAQDWRELGEIAKWNVGNLALVLTVASIEKIQGGDLEGEFLTLEDLLSVQLPGVQWRSPSRP